MYGGWLRILSFLAVLLLVVSVEALPKKKTASTATTANTGTTTGSKAAASSGGVTTATDGSSILDKTVVIKYHLLHSIPRTLPILTSPTAVSQSATRSVHQPTSLPQLLESQEEQQLQTRPAPQVSMSSSMETEVSRSSTSPTKQCKTT